MMHYGHFGAGFALMHFFCFLFGLGVILFLFWAVKNLKKNQLKKLFVSLLVIGLLGMALSGLFLHKGYGCDDDECGYEGKWGIGLGHCPLLDGADEEENS